MADDEQRLIEAVAEVLYLSTSDYCLANAHGRIKAMRQRGITITPPPAPEPTYTVRLTKKELDTWLYEFLYKDIDPEIINRLVALDPDEVPS